MLLHNLSSFIKLLHSYERILALLLWLFLKLLKQAWIFLHQHLHSLQFLIVQQIIFAELLLNQHSVLFVDFNKLLLVNNDFWWNHNPTKFCGIIFILICFNFLISLYCFISESVCYKVFFHWWQCLRLRGYIFFPVKNFVKVKNIKKRIQFSWVIIGLET